MHHRNCPNNICSATESSPRCHIGCWRIGNVVTEGLKEQNIWYMFAVLEHIVSTAYQKAHSYMHCRKRTAIHSKTVNVAEHKRRNMPTLKYKRKNTPALKYQRKYTTALKNGQSSSQRLFELIPGMQKSMFKWVYWVASAPRYTSDICERKCSHRGSVRN